MRKLIGKKYDLRPFSEILEFLLIVSVWAFNEDKFITYPIKIVYILVLGLYGLTNWTKPTKYQLWCVVMTVISLLCVISASDLSKAGYTFVNLLQVFLIAFVTSGYLDSKEKVDRFWRYIVWGGMVLFVRLLLTTPLSDWLSYVRLGSSIGYNANDVGNKAAVSAMVALFLFRGSDHKKKLRYAVAFVVMIMVVLFSGSRKALLGVGIAVVLMYTLGLEDKKKLPHVLMAFVGIALVGYIAVMNIEPLYATIGRRIESMIHTLFMNGSEAGSIDLREKYIQTAWRLIQQNPLLGIGLGNFSTVSGYGVYSHCDYLETMCSFGIPGAIVYYVPLVVIAVKYLTKKKKDAVEYGYLTVLLVLLVNYITMVMYTAAYTQLLIVLAIAAFDIPNNAKTFERIKQNQVDGVVRDSYYETLKDRGELVGKISGAVSKVISYLTRILLPKFNKRVLIGEGFRMRRNVTLNANGGFLCLGKGVFINANSSINCRSEITIGNNVLIGENVHIYDHNHVYVDMGIPISRQGYKCRKVTIGNGCWIGSNVTILPGVTIGDNSIIGANCLIYQDVPAGSVVRSTQQVQIMPRKTGNKD